MIFIAGNMPFVSEIAPLLIVTKLEEFDYAGASAIATIMLAISFAVLLAINSIQAFSRRNLAMPDATSRSPVFRWLLIAIAVAFLALFLLMPLFAVFAEALRRGAETYFSAFTDPDTQTAIQLTLLVAVIAVPLKHGLRHLRRLGHRTSFDFRGKSSAHHPDRPAPFPVSPVVAGLIYVLLFGAKGVFGPLLSDLDFKIIFALPGIVLATVFVTFPFVARELIPLMQEQGTSEEEAALTLGASGLRAFLTVTLPNVRWALLYGVLLCNARAMGRSSAVSVVSGHIRGLTNTMPLHVEILYNEYNFVGAFAVASLLAGLALVTLVAKSVLEWRHGDALARTRRH